MKQYFTDLCLVIILICVMSMFFGNYNVSKTMFERNKDHFEETVSSSQEVKESYVTIQDTSDNHVSSFFETISQYCVKAIEFVVLIFSDFISMIMCNMVY
ncbi:MAG: hypothetical protein HFF36_03630 [Coprobacillus sp.]|nr:hypothetical protein [Coprobacillus sp.]MCI9092867.1 hypothetical protein [Coprobacillus sp.]